MDRVERIKAVIQRIEDRGCKLMLIAFSEQTIRSTDDCIKAIKVLSARSMRLQAIVDSMPRRASFVGATPSVN